VTVNIHEAKTHFSRLIERAVHGEEVIVARSGKPLVRIVPIGGPTRTRTPGLSEGHVRIADTFDEPIPDSLLDAFES